MTEIDPIQFGRLLQAVENLEAKVGTLSSEVAELNLQMSTGKGMVAGLCIAAGGIGAGLTKVVEHIFK